MFTEHADSAFSIKYGKLAYNAAAELIDLLHMILIAPRKIYEELFEKQKVETHALQKLSLCGRKVVAWSDKISFDDVAKICENSHVTPNEVYFSAASSALFTFLEEFKNLVPESLDACARYVEKDYLVGDADCSEGMYHIKDGCLLSLVTTDEVYIFNSSFIFFFQTLPATSSLIFH